MSRALAKAAVKAAALGALFELSVVACGDTERPASTTPTQKSPTPRPEQQTPQPHGPSQPAPAASSPGTSAPSGEPPLGGSDELRVGADTCRMDADCVPDTCCHAAACVARSRAPDCTDALCTLDCRGGTMDCSGKCVCHDGHCAALIRPL